MPKSAEYEGKTLNQWKTASQDKDLDARRKATFASSHWGPKAIPVLTGLLRDEHSDVRSTAAEVLVALGPEAKAAVPALVELLNDTDVNVRVEAAKALGKMGPEGKAAIPALTAASQEDAVRNAAAEALGKIGPNAKTAIPSLAGLLRSDKPSARNSAADALTHIVPDGKAIAIPMFSAMLQDKDGEGARIRCFGFAEDGADAKAAAPALDETTEGRRR